jgi:hypothetical protein
VSTDSVVPLGIATKQYVDTVAGGGGVPGAPANSIQFNNANFFGGDANLTWVPAQGLTNTLATAIGPGATIHAGTGTITPDVLTDWYNSYQDPANESVFANVASPLAICQTYSGDISTANRVMALGSRVNVKHTAVGKNAGAIVSTGAFNTLIGSGAGNAITTGFNNIWIGAAPNTSAATDSSNIVICYDLNLPVGITSFCW